MASDDSKSRPYSFINGRDACKDLTDASEVDSRLIISPAGMFPGDELSKVGP